MNAISPGATDDSVLSGLPPEVFQAIRDWSGDWTPKGRWAHRRTWAKRLHSFVPKTLAVLRGKP